MNMHSCEKQQGLQSMILFIELFANVKSSSFYTSIRATGLLNEFKTFYFRW